MLKFRLLLISLPLFGILHFPLPGTGLVTFRHPDSCHGGLTRHNQMFRGQILTVLRATTKKVCLFVLFASVVLICVNPRIILVPGIQERAEKLEKECLAREAQAERQIKEHQEKQFEECLKVLLESNSTLV